MATTIAAMAMLKPSKIVARSSPAPSGSGRVPSISLKSLAKKGMSEVARLAAEAAAAEGGDNRGLLLLFVVAPAIAWVLYNILQPALNQLNRMRSD
uniref:Photosystem II core complex proteins psbY, chloroplastic n=1 Tax=Oryza barthii TaxID=65489 RepID=A0A0D3GVU5_9ORYZ